jgi:ribosomal protein S18 acetylase RimI-like enzyme
MRGATAASTEPLTMNATALHLPREDDGLRGATIATLAAAFAEDAAVRRFYPGGAEYRRHFPGLLAAFGGRAFEAGVVDLDPACRAAALWFPPGLEPDGDAIMAHLEASVPADRLGALAGGMKLQGSLHPEEPHWYLPWIGVRPEAQGRGLGSALLDLGLARADAEGLPAYLEATSRRNAALYARHGFEVQAIVEAEDYPEIILMWRPARGRPARSAWRGWLREPLVRVRRARAARRRQALGRTLLALDDHLLRDIGLDTHALAPGRV